MKNHRFLWLRNRTTNNRKCEKARNIKEKRTIEMFSTVSKQLVALRSSASADIIHIASKARNHPISGFQGVEKVRRLENLFRSIQKHY